MALPLKKEHVLIAHAKITHPGILVGPALNVDRVGNGSVLIYHASIEAIANATGVIYLIQINPKNIDNDSWVTVKQFTTGTTIPILANIAGSEAAGEKTIAVVAGEEVGILTGDIVYIRDTTVEADSEWGLVDETPTDQVNLVDGLTRAKDSSDDILTQAEIFEFEMDLVKASRLRVVVLDRPTTGSDTAVKASFFGEI